MPQEDEAHMVSILVSAERNGLERTVTVAWRASPCTSEPPVQLLGPSRAQASRVQAPAAGSSRTSKDSSTLPS